MRINPAMRTDEHGIVLNPLRAAVASRLETERAKRDITHKELVELLRRGTPDGKFSYGTYIKTLRQENNVTLRTLAHMAATLDIAIADFLYGDAAAPDWTRKMDTGSIRQRLAMRLELAREKRNLHRYKFAKFLGVGEVTYFKLERGAANVTVDTIAVVAKALDQEPLDFLFGPHDPVGP